jgi:hypothetical protein
MMSDKVGNTPPQAQLEPRGDFSPAYSVKFSFLIGFLLSAKYAYSLFSNASPPGAPLSWWDRVFLGIVVLAPWVLGVGCYYQMKHAVGELHPSPEQLNKLRVIALYVAVSACAIEFVIFRCLHFPLR